MEVKKYDFHYISADFPYSFYDWKRGSGVKAVTLHPENMTSGGHHEKTTDGLSLLRQTDRLSLLSHEIAMQGFRKSLPHTKTTKSQQWLGYGRKAYTTSAGWKRKECEERNPDMTIQ